MKQLKQIVVAEEVFDAIINKYPSKRHSQSVKHDFSYGYCGKYPKAWVLYDDEYCVCRTQCVMTVAKDLGLDYSIDCEYWNQVMCRKCDSGTVDVDETGTVSSKLTIEQDVTGNYAWNYLKKVLRKYYAENEFEAQLSIFELKEYKLQIHYTKPVEQNIIYRLDDCYEFDINAAHTWALITIFPKAKYELLRMYEHRHDNDNRYKKIFNYFVGMLCRKGHRLTYNWIVNAVSVKLDNAINKCLESGGSLIYANTDGMIVHNPSQKLITNNKIGDFKLEFSGTMYYMWGKNYFILQKPAEHGGYELVGNMLKKVRSNVDLSKGISVSYDRVLTEGGTFTADNVCVGTYPIKNM